MDICIPNKEFLVSLDESYWGYGQIIEDNTVAVSFIVSASETVVVVISADTDNEILDINYRLFSFMPSTYNINYGEAYVLTGDRFTDNKNWLKVEYDIVKAPDVVDNGLYAASLDSGKIKFKPIFSSTPATSGVGLLIWDASNKQFRLTVFPSLPDSTNFYIPKVKISGDSISTDWQLAT